MLNIVCLFLLSICAVGCGPRYVDYFPYHDDGAAKPKVVFLPIKGVCETDLEWDLSKKLTEAIHCQAMDDGVLFMYSPNEVEAGLRNIGDIDFFANDELLAKEFCEADFVVISELFSHDYEHYEFGQKKQKCGAPDCSRCETMLVMKFRVRVVDLRPRCPRVALQEIITNRYVVPPGRARERRPGQPGRNPNLRISPGQ